MTSAPLPGSATFAPDNQNPWAMAAVRIAVNARRNLPRNGKSIQPKEQSAARAIFRRGTLTMTEAGITLDGEATSNQNIALKICPPAAGFAALVILALVCTGQVLWAPGIGLLFVVGLVSLLFGMCIDEIVGEIFLAPFTLTIPWKQVASLHVSRRGRRAALFWNVSDTETDEECEAAFGWRTSYYYLPITGIKHEQSEPMIAAIKNYSAATIHTDALLTEWTPAAKVVAFITLAIVIGVVLLIATHIH